MAKIPVVDFAGFLHGTAADKSSVAAAIRDACEDTGFFYLIGHDVPPAQVAAIFAAARRFFTLPLEQRMELRLTPRENRGYQPLGSRFYGDKADAPDLNE